MNRHALLVSVLLLLLLGLPAAAGDAFVAFFNGCPLFESNPITFSYLGPTPGSGKHFCILNGTKLLMCTKAYAPTVFQSAANDCPSYSSGDFYICPVLAGVTVDLECERPFRNYSPFPLVPTGNNFCFQDDSDTIVACVPIVKTSKTSFSTYAASSDAFKTTATPSMTKSTKQPM